MGCVRTHRRPEATRCLATWWHSAKCPLSHTSLHCRATGTDRLSAAVLALISKPLPGCRRSLRLERDSCRAEPIFISTCDYSSIAIISGIIVAGCVLIATFLFRVTGLQSDIPPGGSSSGAITAACHPSRTGEDIVLKPRAWAMVAGVRDEAGAEHSAFSWGGCVETCRR